MKKIISALYIGIALSISLSAFTWSGVVDNTTKASSTKSDFSEMSLFQSNSLYLSVASKLSSNLNFTAEGLYKYSYSLPNIKTTENSKLKHVVDIDLFKLSGRWNTSFGAVNLMAGRYSVLDASGVVFTQTCDGVYVGIETGNLKTAYYAGYTGLLNSLNVSMTIPSKNKNEQFYALSAGLIPFSAEVAADFAGNSLGLQAFGFIDAKQETDPSYYATLSLNGPVSTLGSYSVTATLGTIKFEDVMLYSKINTAFYLSKSGILNLGVEYASGEQFGLKPFKTITAGVSSNFAGGSPHSSVLMPMISAALIKNNMYAALSEKIVCLMPEKECALEGFDTGLNILYNIFSDLQIGLDLNMFIDTKTSSDLNYYSGTLKASLSF